MPSRSAANLLSSGFLCSDERRRSWTFKTLLCFARTLPCFWKYGTFGRKTEIEAETDRGSEIGRRVILRTRICVNFNCTCMVICICVCAHICICLYIYISSVMHVAALLRVAPRVSCAGTTMEDTNQGSTPAHEREERQGGLRFRNEAESEAAEGAPSDCGSDEEIDETALFAKHDASSGYIMGISGPGRRRQKAGLALALGSLLCCGAAVAFVVVSVLLAVHPARPRPSSLEACMPEKVPGTGVPEAVW